MQIFPIWDLWLILHFLQWSINKMRGKISYRAWQQRLEISKSPKLASKNASSDRAQSTPIKNYIVRLIRYGLKQSTNLDWEKKWIEWRAKRLNIRKTFFVVSTIKTKNLETVVKLFTLREERDFVVGWTR